MNKKQDKKKKHGFTLIELLAVIVILAVIALIVTPIVTGIIGSTKESADMRSAEGYVNAANNFFTNAQINEEKKNKLGSNIIDQIEIGGKKASGSIIVDDKGQVEMAIVINNKCYRKNKNSSEIIPDENIDDCSVIVAVIPPDRCFEYETGDSISIKNYKCGNSVKGLNYETFEVEFNNDGEYTDIEIPSVINGKTVTWVSNYAFCGTCFSKDDPSAMASTKVGINSVTFPSSIKGVSKSSFVSNQITRVTLSSGFTQIGEDAFDGNKITSITIPSNIESLGFFSLSHNHLTSLNIPNTVLSISEGALVGNMLPDNQAFIYYRDDLNNNGTIEDTEIDKTILTNYAGAKRENVIIPDGIVKIDDSAFEAIDLKSVTIPNSVKIINESAFDRNLLTSIVIPEGVEEIGYGAFGDNVNLTSVTLPSSITSIDETSFEGDEQLSNITINKPCNSIANAPWGAPSSTVVTWSTVCP